MEQFFLSYSNITGLSVVIVSFKNKTKQNPIIYDFKMLLFVSSVQKSHIKYTYEMLPCPHPSHSRIFQIHRLLQASHTLSLSAAEVLAYLQF